MAAIFGHMTTAETPTSGCSYVARIAFDYGLRQFKIGEDFDFKALGINESQAYDLWVSGRLLVKPKLAPQQPQTQKRKER